MTTDRLDRIERILSSFVDRQTRLEAELTDFRRESEKRYTRIENQIEQMATNMVVMQEAIIQTDKTLQGLIIKIDTYFANASRSQANAERWRSR